MSFKPWAEGVFLPMGVRGGWADSGRRSDISFPSLSKLNFKSWASGSTRFVGALVWKVSWQNSESSLNSGVGVCVCFVLSAWNVKEHS